MSKIVKLTIIDYLGIESQAIDPGEINFIEGGNKKGKSAILKAIREAFIGSGHSPENIRLGAKKADLMVDLDSGVKIHRKQTQSSNSVSVVADGQPISKGVAFLKEMLGPAFLFNPVEFYRANTKTRREMILKAVEFTLNRGTLIKILAEKGISLNGAGPIFDKADYSEHGLVVLDKIKGEVFERRAEINRDRDRLRKTIDKQREGIPEDFNAERFVDFDLENAMNELTEINEHNNQLELKTQERVALGREYNNLKSEIADLEVKLEAAKKRFEEVRAVGQALNGDIERFEKKPVDWLRETIQEHSNHQASIQRMEEIRKYENELGDTETEWRGLDNLHKALSNDVPRIAMEQVKLPVEGLEVKMDTVELNGVAIDNLSTSEQVRLAVGISRALVGDLKVICVDGCETMDADSLKAFEKAIADDDIQYFITRVTSGDLKVSKKDSGKPRVEPTQTELSAFG